MPADTRTFATACPRNCYSTCGLRVTVEEGRVRRIEPHPGKLATPNGACLKGLSYIEREYSSERVLFPLRRDAGTGMFQRIPWDEALDGIAGRLTSVRERYGPQGKGRQLCLSVI